MLTLPLPPIPDRLTDAAVAEWILLNLFHCSAILLWNFSELTQMPIGDFAPVVFGVAIAADGMEVD